MSHNKISFLMKEAGLTVSELATYLHVSKSLLGKLCCGNRAITSAMAKSLASYFCCTPQFILGTSDTGLVLYREVSSKENNSYDTLVLSLNEYYLAKKQPNYSQKVNNLRCLRVFALSEDPKDLQFLEKLYGPVIVREVR